jgi:hypothetical protein
MKRLILTSLAALSLLGTPTARASWNYNPGDLLLVFRNGSQDVEFDIGSVTNVLGKTNGYTATITGWDPALVTTTFGGFSGLTVALVATSGGTNWLSGAEPNYSAYNVSAQGASTLSSLINGVGTKPLFPTPIPTAEANAYSIDIGGLYKTRSYDYIVSGGTYNSVPTFNGNSAFTVEQTLPGSLDFWSIASTSVYPNSPPDHLVGTFTFSDTGVLTFVAGPRASTLTNVSHSGNVSAVQFTTTVGNTYSVGYASQLGGALSTWSVDPTTLVGDGHSDTLYHTNSTAAAVQFYNIRTQ